MIETIGLLTIGFALCVFVASADETRRDRQRARAELARHQALPPMPPHVWKGETISLNPDDVVRALPGRARNWRNN
jgi:hypothetical protein